jgi:hypothetical protein
LTLGLIPTLPFNNASVVFLNLFIIIYRLDIIKIRVKVWFGIQYIPEVEVSDDSITEEY